MSFVERERIDELAEAIVLAEPESVADLRAVRLGVEELARAADDGGLFWLARLLEELGKRLLAGEATSGSYDAFHTEAGAMVAALQTAFSAGRDPRPEDLSPPETSSEGRRTGGPLGDTGPMSGHGLFSGDPELLGDFLVEARDHLLKARSALESRRAGGEDGEDLQVLYRAYHTIKGLADYLGLAPVRDLARGGEALMAILREAATAPTEEELDALQSCLDGLGGMAEEVALLQRGEGEKVEGGDVDASLRALDALCEERRREVETESEESEAGGRGMLAGDRSMMKDFVVEAEEHLAAANRELLVLETAPDRVEALNAVFRAFHTIKGLADYLGLEDIRTLSHGAEGLLGRARSGKIRIEGPQFDVVFQALDRLGLLVHREREVLDGGTTRGEKPSVEDLLQRIEALGEGLARSPAPASELSSPETSLPEVWPPDDSDPEDGGKDPDRPVVDDPSLQSGLPSYRGVVKVEALALDHLVDTIGELVVAESMASRAAGQLEKTHPGLIDAMRQLGSITRQLQEMATTMRMVPVRPVFERMARVVRDAARKAGKELRFHVVGAETTLDRTLVDQIAEPLMHLLRNAVDHGIESSPRERMRSGKPEVGRVELRARHEGGSIYIEVEDDGRGLDPEAILRKARERGLVVDEEPKEEDVIALIFEAGLSTAQRVTGLSGRGVGLDVVRRSFERLRGSIRVSSEVSKGTLFSICLPLTLAIIDGMVVRVGSESYVLPTHSIVRTLQVSEGKVRSVAGCGEVILHQQRTLPLLHLRELLEVSERSEDESLPLVIVVEAEGRSVGLLVDELSGQQQVVIKNLAREVLDVEGIAGGAIMPDGRVGLVLDVPGLLRLARREERP